MLTLAQKLCQIVFLRYLLASITALVFDVSFLALLVTLGASAAPAATASYALGIAVHWLITSRAVFREEVETDSFGRARQKVLFVLSALAGMSVTTGIVSIGTGLGIALAPIKAIAVGTSFFVSWFLRRWFIFRPSQTA